MNLLVQLKEVNKQSILLVTHDPYVATFANRVLFFHDGQIINEYHTTQTEQDLDIILSKFKQITRGEH
jgi:putative ABC transport system ATP-binding protein